MSAHPSTTFVTLEEYLERELHAEFKNEYFNGEIFPMFAVTPQHAAIVANVIGEIRLQLKGKPCRVYSSELRLRVTPTGLYTYPDMMVICGDLQLVEGRTDTVMNPVLIVEVLSKSTQDYDRGQKFEHYRTLSSLIDYLTVAQDDPHVVHYTRQSANSWLLVDFADLGQSIALGSISCVLPLAEVYDKIDWQTVDSEAKPI